MKIKGKDGCIIAGQDYNGKTTEVNEKLGTQLIAAGLATASGREVETATDEAPEQATSRRTTRTTRTRGR